MLFPIRYPHIWRMCQLPFAHRPSNRYLSVAFCKEYAISLRFFFFHWNLVCNSNRKKPNNRKRDLNISCVWSLEHQNAFDLHLQRLNYTMANPSIGSFLPNVSESIGNRNWSMAIGHWLNEYWNSDCFHIHIVSFNSTENGYFLFVQEIHPSVLSVWHDVSVSECALCSLMLITFWLVHSNLEFSFM